MSPFSKSELMPQEETLEILRRKGELFIGIPKETHFQETRVCLTPDAVSALVSHGHRVMVEAGAGEGAKFNDKEYSEAGAEVTNETQDSTKLYFYGLPTCDSIILKNSSDFYGAIYAPNAMLDIRNSGEIYGSFVGEDMILHNSVNFHYDYALQNANPGDPGAKFVPTKWHEE